MLKKYPVELVGLNVSDFDKSLEFYLNTLGLEGTWIDRENCTCAFLVGSIYLMIRENPREASAGGARVYFTVQGIQSLRTRLQDAGISVSAIVERGRGKFLDFSDPDGNRLGLFEPNKE